MQDLKNPYQILNKRIFITTRESGSSMELINTFSNHGARILEFPMIKTAPEKISKKDYDILNDTEKFQWIVFTSANGVKYFFHFLNETGKSHEVFEKIKIAVIGNKTEKRLNEYSLKADFVSKGLDSRMFAKELKSVFSNSNTRVLFPTGSLTPDFLENTLQNDAHFTRINLYNTLQPKSISKEILNQIEMNNYDIIFFYSPSAINNFYELFVNQIIIKNLKAACIGPATEKACNNLGITPIFTAKKPSTESLVQATINYYNKT